METGESWRSLFENWPESIQRKGAIVTAQGESVPFTNFLISGGLLLIERDGPDAAGARKVIVAYNDISAVKLSSASELTQFQSMGFQPPL